MASNTKSLHISAPSVAAPVVQPRPTIGSALTSAVKHAVKVFRSGGDPPDFPGALGAHDLDLIRLSRTSPGKSVREANDRTLSMLQFGPFIIR